MQRLALVLEGAGAAGHRAVLCAPAPRAQPGAIAVDVRQVDLHLLGAGLAVAHLLAQRRQLLPQRGVASERSTFRASATRHIGPSGLTLDTFWTPGCC